MTDPFQELLHQLGKVFHLALHVDKHHACSIRVFDTLTLQLQLDISQEHLLLFAKIAEVPPGRFRENVMREALKANDLPDPAIAIFCYLASTNQLALYQRYPISLLDGEKLAGLAGAFIETAKSWQEAIAHGQSAPASKKL